MSNVSFWWRMIRPHTLSATLAPVFVGTAYAMQVNGHLKDLIFVATLLSALLIQIAANLFNEYFDFIHGLDTPDSIGNSGTIVRDGASPSFVLVSALVCYSLAVLLGFYLSWATSWWLAVVGALCMAIGFFYAGGPYPLSRTPFGELFAGGIMGCGLVLISYFIQSGNITFAGFALSIPSMILVALILTANNIRDRINDEKNGRRTLAILLGQRRSLIFMLIGFALAYLALFILLPLGHHPIVLLPLLSIRRVPRITRIFSKSGLSPQEMMPAMVETSLLNRDVGYLLALALILEPYL